MQRLGEKPALCGPLAYLTGLGPIYPARTSSLPILRLHPRPSFSLWNQDHPGEFPGKWFTNVSPPPLSLSLLHQSGASSTQTVPGTAPGIACAESYPRPRPPSSLRLPRSWRSTPIHTQTPSQPLQCIHLRLNSISGSSLISLCVGARMRSFVLILN